MPGTRHTWAGWRANTLRKPASTRLGCLSISLLIGLSASAPLAIGQGTLPRATVLNSDHAQSRLPVTPIAAGSAAATIATSASLSGDGTQTVFKLQLTKGVTAEVFTLSDPYRVIIDLPDVGFRLPDATGDGGRGLISAFRYGQFAEGKARVVLDAVRPVLITKAEMTALPAGSGIELAVVLEPTSAQAFGGGTGAASQPAPAANAATAPSERPQRAKPIILIDPGHGGIDGGAVGSVDLIEKNVVLAVARVLQAQLAKTGRYDVRMTRSKDVFVSLDQRLKLSRELVADLFISLHADSIADAQAVQSVRGATVYTLSERASDEQARRMAEKENASDLIAGINSSTNETGEVKGILIDLMKRETANYSADFSTTLVGKLKQSVRLSRDPQRSAAFKVLKQTHAPSVLVELGYLTHPEDQKLLGSAEWRRTVAKSIGQAVDSFFSKRTVGAANQSP